MTSLEEMSIRDRAIESVYSHYWTNALVSDVNILCAEFKLEMLNCPKRFFQTVLQSKSNNSHPSFVTTPVHYRLDDTDSIPYSFLSSGDLCI